MSEKDILRTLAGDVLCRYIEDHMGTSIGRFSGTFSGRPRDVILPSGYVSVNISMTDINIVKAQL